MINYNIKILVAYARGVHIMCDGAYMWRFDEEEIMPHEILDYDEIVWSFDDDVIYTDNLTYPFIYNIFHLNIIPIDAFICASQLNGNNGEWTNTDDSKDIKNDARKSEKKRASNNDGIRPCPKSFNPGWDCSTVHFHNDHTSKSQGAKRRIDGKKKSGKSPFCVDPKKLVMCEIPNDICKTTNQFHWHMSNKRMKENNIKNIKDKKNPPELAKDMSENEKLKIAEKGGKSSDILGNIEDNDRTYKYIHGDEEDSDEYESVTGSTEEDEDESPCGSKDPNAKSLDEFIEDQKTVIQALRENLEDMQKGDYSKQPETHSDWWADPDREATDCGSDSDNEGEDDVWENVSTTSSNSVNNHDEHESVTGPAEERLYDEVTSTVVVFGSRIVNNGEEMSDYSDADQILTGRVEDLISWRVHLTFIYLSGRTVTHDLDNSRRVIEFDSYLRDNIGRSSIKIMSPQENKKYYFNSLSDLAMEMTETNFGKLDIEFFSRIINHYDRTLVYIDMEHNKIMRIGTFNDYVYLCRANTFNSIFQYFLVGAYGELKKEIPLAPAKNICNALLPYVTIMTVCHVVDHFETDNHELPLCCKIDSYGEYKEEVCSEITSVNENISIKELKEVKDMMNEDERFIEKLDKDIAEHNAYVDKIIAENPRPKKKVKTEDNGNTVIKGPSDPEHREPVTLVIKSGATNGPSNVLSSNVHAHSASTTPLNTVPIVNTIPGNNSTLVTSVKNPKQPLNLVPIRSSDSLRQEVVFFNGIELETVKTWKKYWNNVLLWLCAHEKTTSMAIRNYKFSTIISPIANSTVRVRNNWFGRWCNPLARGDNYGITEHNSNITLDLSKNIYKYNMTVNIWTRLYDFLINSCADMQAAGFMTDSNNTIAPYPWLMDRVMKTVRELDSRYFEDQNVIPTLYTILSVVNYLVSVHTIKIASMPAGFRASVNN